MEVRDVSKERKADGWLWGIYTCDRTDVIEDTAALVDRCGQLKSRKEKQAAAKSGLGAQWNG